MFVFFVELTERCRCHYSSEISNGCSAFLILIRVILALIFCCPRYYTVAWYMVLKIAIWIVGLSGPITLEYWTQGCNYKCYMVVFVCYFMIERTIFCQFFMSQIIAVSSFRYGYRSLHFSTIMPSFCFLWACFNLILLSLTLRFNVHTKTFRFAYMTLDIANIR